MSAQFVHKVNREDDLTWTVCGLSVDDTPDLLWQRDLEGVSCPWCITGRTCPKVAEQIRQARRIAYGY